MKCEQAIVDFSNHAFAVEWCFNNVAYDTLIYLALPMFIHG